MPAAEWTDVCDIPTFGRVPIVLIGLITQDPV